MYNLCWSQPRESRIVAAGSVCSSLAIEPCVEMLAGTRLIRLLLRLKWQCKFLFYHRFSAPVSEGVVLILTEQFAQMESDSSPVEVVNFSYHHLSRRAPLYLNVLIQRILRFLHSSQDLESLGWRIYSSFIVHF